MAGIDFIKDLAVVMLVAGLVGWLCHRVGLSVIVGFLAAGMFIGPYTPPFSLVTDIGRIETLALSFMPMENIRNTRPTCASSAGSACPCWWRPRSRR
jgi:hypothetical protein